jgi:hypothetical protein
MLPKSFLGIYRQHLHPRVSFIIRGVALDSCQLEAFLAELHAAAPSEEFLRPRDDAPGASPFEDWVA